MMSDFVYIERNGKKWIAIVRGPLAIISSVAIALTIIHIYL